MMFSKRTSTVLFLILAGLFIGFVFTFYWPTNKPKQSGNEGNQIENKMVRLDQPQHGQVISSPLRIEGEARGHWYFEANFPVTLLSENERVITRHYATAEGGWMTEKFVPFNAIIPFSQPEGGSGWLVLERANPSGLPKHADEIRIPVEFPRESSEISVFFNKKEVAECENTVPVSRTISRTQAPARVSLKNLFAGPTWREEQEGYHTSIPDDVNIERLVIHNRTANLELNEKIDEEVAGACWVQAIRSQIENTLRQFQSVDSVVISVDGRTDEVLQP